MLHFCRFKIFTEADSLLFIMALEMRDFKNISASANKTKTYWFKISVVLAIALIVVGLFFLLRTEEAPYLIVLDPGHGGKTIPPLSIYGDKYNPLIEEYGDSFKEGAASHGLRESEEVFAIAKAVQKYLKLTQTSEGRDSFHAILKKYSEQAPYPEYKMRVKLSREADYREVYQNNQEDVNALYRMYDYPDIRTGQIIAGRMSRINSLKPALVVSIHLNGGASPKKGEMGAVITPSYQTFARALEYAKADPEERKLIKRDFYRGPYKNWMNSCGLQGNFSNFLCDASIYFTGYWSQQSGLKPNEKVFRGYRHNMIDWQYSDDEGWVEEALEHKKHSRFAKYLKDFKAEGKFWQREQQKPETWKREQGYEDYGGDNLYAGNEILRYIRQGLLVHNVDTENSLPRLAPPYLSTWTVPTYTNAVNAYLELGYLQSKRDSARILHHKEVYAEAIAVGIYSLFYSMQHPLENKIKSLPWGQAIEWHKYGNYFEN